MKIFKFSNKDGRLFLLPGIHISRIAQKFNRLWRFLNKLAYLYFLTTAGLCHAGSITMVPAQAVQPIGSNMSQNEACELALSEAKRNALQTHFGIFIGSKTVIECDAIVQKETGNNCELFESSWSLINSNGFIKRIANLKRRTDFSPELKSPICLISGDFMIEEFSGKPDASFETEISISEGSTLTLRDSLHVQIDSNKPAFHYVFYWAPYQDKDTYYRLFPNEFDKQTDAAQLLKIPSSSASKEYQIKLTLPEGFSISREYLILLSFKKAQDDVPIKISESGFNTWLQTKNRELWKQDRANYRILGE